MVFGFDETSMAYDVSRAHSADVWFLKARAWFWGITMTVAAFCLGNVLGALNVNVFGFLVELVKSILW
jgi:hypothetical protein